MPRLDNCWAHIESVIVFPAVTEIGTAVIARSVLLPGARRSFLRDAGFTLPEAI